MIGGMHLRGVARRIAHLMDWTGQVYRHDGPIPLWLKTSQTLSYSRAMQVFPCRVD